ncbi:hypothetical protein [Bacillus velezensis]|uniref:hypothetical protein n=1 Tax=Bacillus velezensis TaxID=492670 RepID=UPI0024180F66|nr:hypothetical protein [Bacillus velezensis]WFP05440.1 hypothetical protein JEQ22_20240 [Bacillus velezensis]
MKTRKPVGTIYKLVHECNLDHDKTAIFLETTIEPLEMMNILSAVEFKFEELVDESLTIHRQHLINILEKFYDVKNVTEEYRKFLPQTQLETDKWAIITTFKNVIGLDIEYKVVFPIIQIDLSGAREYCCENYDEIMERTLPNTQEFEEEIKNIKDFYTFNQNSGG